MADDDYSAQLSWQSQSKDNLKCVYYRSPNPPGSNSMRLAPESLWTTSVLLSTNDSKRIVGTHCPSKLYGRCVTQSKTGVSKVYMCMQVIQQATGQQVSQPVAQIVAGFSKVFVGEIVEKGMRIRSLA